MIFSHRLSLAAMAALAAVALTLPQSLAQSASARDPQETPEAFPDGPNREETFYFCTACHNFKLTAAQGMTREKWDETLQWMTVKHNMPKLEGDDLKKILDYLATALPPKSQGQGVWKNPFLN
jgi:hypothetical protein